MPEPAVVFVRSKKASREALLTLGGGLLAIVVGSLMFVNELSSPPHTGGVLPGAVGGIFAAGVITLLFGLVMARSPSRITLEPDGMRLEGMLSRSRLLWTQIAEIRRDKLQQQGSRPRLDVIVLRDSKGKTLARITGTFDRFAALVAEIEARSSRASGGPTYDRQREVARKLRGQIRERRMLGGMGIAFLCGGTFLCWVATQDLIHERGLRTEGVPEQARIVRRYMRHVTPRIEYSFVDRKGASFTRDAAMDAGAWEALDGAERVLIVYLPSDPEWSHLMLGEVSLEGPPGQSLLIGALSLLMGAAFVTLTAKGYCGFERKNGKLRLIRVGDVDEELELLARLGR